jgi:DNA-binding NtrC family response regulator
MALMSDTVLQSPEHPTFIARVLVADGSEAQRSSLASMLRRISSKIEVIEASHGENVERVLFEHTIDLSFIDRRLPGFRRDALIGRCEGLVLVTDGLRPEWSQTAMLVGAYEVMLKPYNESRVEKLLSAFERLRRPTTVLLADRSRTARRMIREMLESTWLDVQIEETDTRATAIRALCTKCFDIAIVDADLDEDMGLEIAYRISKHATAPKVILISSEQHLTHAAAGMFGLSLLRKPFAPAALEAAIYGILKLWRPYLLNAQLRELSRPCAGAIA